VTFTPRSLYVHGLAAGVSLVAVPVALLVGVDPRTVRTSVARLVSGDRSFGQQGQALGLLTMACIFVGGGAAVIGLLVALFASIVSSSALDIVSRVILAVIAPAGALLVIVRARSLVGGRRYDLEREQRAFPGAEPRPWGVLPMVVTYGLGLWVLSRG
jgi:hypothetical protein